MSISVDTKKMYIIDGSSLLYRAFYGLAPMHTSKGKPVHAVYGFCRAIKKIIDDFNPGHLVIVWDAAGMTMRKELYASYKATRQAVPNDLFEQKEAIQQWAEMIGIKQLVCQGWEADDVIASLVKKFKSYEIIIIGPDKDLHQLISATVTLYDPMKKLLYTKEMIESKYGFEVAKIPFYYALVGDSSDNIPGAKGVGPKTATALVQQFSTVDDLYRHVALIASDATRKKIIASEVDVRLSYTLFLLAYPEIVIEEEDLLFDSVRWVDGYSFFLEYEFKSLISDDMVKKASFSEKPKGTFGRVILITDKKKLEELCVKIATVGYCAIDTETNGLMPLDQPLVGCSFAYNAEEAFYVPLRHRAEGSDEQIPYADALAVLKTILEDVGIKKIFHHAKFDLHVFAHSGIIVQGLYFDSLIAASLLRTNADKIGLKPLSDRLLGEPMKSFDEVLQKRKSFEYVPLGEATEYAARDALQTYKLWRFFEKEFAHKVDLKKLFFDLEMPVCEVLFRMEEKGILLDAQYLENILMLVDKKISEVQQKIVSFLEAHRIEGASFINLNAPRQIEKLLFDDLGLKPREKSSKGARSTNQDVLEVLSKEHPIPRLIVQYRELMKLKTTYILPLPLLVQKRTGRIHTSYNQCAVVTGRLSSNDPNMQNIPVAHEHGIDIRKAFIAAPGCSFISVDYSQIELRVLAHITQDVHLVNAFLGDEDIHAKTAANIFGVLLTEVTHEQRQIGKRINFSVMYGMTPFGLSKDLGISLKDAKNYIDAYFEQYQGVQAWMEAVVELARKTGYVATLWGRRRYIPELQEKNKMLFESGRRAAINTPIQGTSSELIKWSMCSIDRYLQGNDGYGSLLLQIHDEVLLEVPDAHVSKVAEFVRNSMEHIVAWRVPLRVSVRIGKNWSEITK